MQGGPFPGNGLSRICIYYKKSKEAAMVKSVNTVNLTSAELKGIQKSLEEADAKERKRFREEFDPNDMGFVGRKEGI